MNTVISYHEDLGNPDFRNTANLWRKDWIDQGWRAVILGRNIAKHHPKYEAIVEKAKELPTANNRSFEESCYVRWCAFSVASAPMIPKVFADYDVFARVSYPPRDTQFPLNGDPDGGPGWVVGDKALIDSIIDRILDYVPDGSDVFNGSPHVSDMIIIQKNRNLFTHWSPEVACYTAQGWRNRPLVHFGSSYLPGKSPKHQEIEEILKQERMQHV